MSFLAALVLCSSFSFLIYGVLCLSSQSMKSEFERFGMDRLRSLTGVLEILGGLGLLVGLAWPPATWMSSGGLALLMLLGMGVRVRANDGALRTLPAVVLMLVNMYVFVASLKAN
jgi:uncharacterized membrane protein YphA (DoxX/SURF4 family)